MDEQKGIFVKNEDGTLHIIVNKCRIELNYSPENYSLARLFLRVCGINTLSLIAKNTIQRLMVHADDKANRMRLKRFAAFSSESSTIYVPLVDGSLLHISDEGRHCLPNGQNCASIWVEHPENNPLKYLPEVDIRGTLAAFEDLIVTIQACKISEMRWFVAMHEGFFPYIRDAFSARFILVHIGPSQHGETTGAQRFTLLHGLGEVKGDFSVAALANDGDCGFLVLDNKEQANFEQNLIDHCLFLSTGAQRGRSSQAGHVRKSASRPVTVITSIEGVPKKELQNRCVEIEYRLTKGCESRGGIETEISRRRDEICSSMMSVLHTYLRVRAERRPTPNPVPNFPEHFMALCDLLRAYGELAGRPKEWSKLIIDTSGIQFFVVGNRMKTNWSTQ